MKHSCIEKQKNQHQNMMRISKNDKDWNDREFLIPEHHRKEKLFESMNLLYIYDLIKDQSLNLILEILTE